MAEVPGTAEVVVDDAGTEPDIVEDATAGATDAVAAATPTTTVATSAEQFIDPRDLAPELQPHFKRMQAAFTKKMQTVAKETDKVKLVDQFRSNPDFAKQLILAEAQRLGLQVSDPVAKPASAGTGGGSAIPQEFIEAVRAELPAEVQWMAPALAKATYSQVKAQVAPLLQQNQQRAQQERQGEWDTLTSQLSERAPGWEAHEDDMLALLDFLQSPALKHPTFGSKVDILFNLATGNAAATQQALQRMSDAGRRRTLTGQSARTAVPNVTERVLKAPSKAAAWQEAARAAIASTQTGAAAS